MCNLVPMSVIKKILLFFPSLLYFLITKIRNRLFDFHLLKSKSFPNPQTIVIGNLAMGGTGKSPAVSFLLKNWNWNKKVAVLSRGYGRKTKGFHWANSLSSSMQLGDEPMAYHLMFPHIPLAVGEDRVRAIEQMKKDLPDLSCIILDDAFQHRSLKPTLSIICTTFQDPFFDDHVFPMGRLREARTGIKRADAVIVTRCPDQLSVEKKTRFRKRIHSYAKDDIPVFFAGIQYGQAIGHDLGLIKQWHLVAGIANPELFFEKAMSLGSILSQKTYADHHHFSNEELTQMNSLALNMPEHEAFLTTHKDFVRFQDHFQKFPHLKSKLYYLPMEMYFLDGNQGFWAWLGMKLGR